MRNRPGICRFAVSRPGYRERTEKEVHMEPKGQDAERPDGMGGDEMGGGQEGGGQDGGQEGGKGGTSGGGQGGGA